MSPTHQAAGHAGQMSADATPRRHTDLSYPTNNTNLAIFTVPVTKIQHAYPTELFIMNVTFKQAINPRPTGVFL